MISSSSSSSLSTLSSSSFSPDVAPTPEHHARGAGSAGTRGQGALLTQKGPQESFKGAEHLAQVIPVLLTGVNILC